MITLALYVGACRVPRENDNKKNASRFSHLCGARLDWFAFGWKNIRKKLPTDFSTHVANFKKFRLFAQTSDWVKVFFTRKVYVCSFKENWLGASRASTSMRKTAWHFFCYHFPGGPCTHLHRERDLTYPQNRSQKDRPPPTFWRSDLFKSQNTKQTAFLVPPFYALSAGGVCVCKSGKVLSSHEEVKRKTCVSDRAI